MKKIYALLLGVAVVSLSVVSCSNKDFDDKFYDPSKTTTVTCDKLMSGVFHVGSITYKGYGYMTYWRLYTWEGVIAQFTQQKGFTNESGGVYYLQDSWCNDRWTNFYETLVQFRKMQDVAGKENNADNQIFLDLAEVFILDQLDQVVTAFGPAPYSKAGYLAITGDLASSRPEYESDEVLFGMMIDRLGELYNEITSLSISRRGFRQTQEAGLHQQWQHRPLGPLCQFAPSAYRYAGSGQGQPHRQGSGRHQGVRRQKAGRHLRVGWCHQRYLWCRGYSDRTGR